MVISLTRKSKAIAIVIAFLFISCSREQETRNVIVLMADGCSTSGLSVARWYRQTVDSLPGNLNVDPYICGIMRMSSACSPISGSSESMSAVMTGERTGSGYVSMYPAPGRYGDMVELDSTRYYQPLATLLEAAKVERGKSTGMVVTVEYWHATPAACAAHAESRGNESAICSQIASQNLDVMFGGGSMYLSDEVRSILTDNGTTVIEEDRKAFDACEDDKVWATFGAVSCSYEMDRDPAEEPSLAEMTDKAIKLLSRNRKGFFLMVEGSKIDYAAHAMDPSTFVNEFLAFDDAIKVAVDFAKKDKHTTVVVFSDHGTSGITLGSYYYKDYTAKPIEYVFCDLKDFKMSSSKLAKTIMSVPADQIRPLMKKFTGIDITAEEERELVEHKNNNTVDYMTAAYDPTLQGLLARIMSSRTKIGFSSGSHTGEDVFYAVYHPHDIRPEGYICNIDLNAYLFDVLGLKRSQRDMSDEWFAKASLLFEGREMETVVSDGRQTLVVRSNGHELRVPADHSLVYLDGEAVDIGTVSVFQNGEFYVNRRLESFDI